MPRYTAPVLDRRIQLVYETERRDVTRTETTPATAGTETYEFLELVAAGHVSSGPRRWQMFGYETEPTEDAHDDETTGEINLRAGVGQTFARIFSPEFTFWSIKPFYLVAEVPGEGSNFDPSIPPEVPAVTASPPSLGTDIQMAFPTIAADAILTFRFEGQNEYAGWRLFNPRGMTAYRDRDLVGRMDLTVTFSGTPVTTTITTTENVDLGPMVWASRRDLRSSEFVDSHNSIGNTLASKYVIRYRTDLDESWRIKDPEDDVKWGIEGIRLLNRKRYVEIFASRGVL